MTNNADTRTDTATRKKIVLVSGIIIGVLFAWILATATPAEHTLSKPAYCSSYGAMQVEFGHRIDSLLLDGWRVTSPVGPNVMNDVIKSCV